jgi:hypothetical protein
MPRLSVPQGEDPRQFATDLQDALTMLGGNVTKPSGVEKLVTQLFPGATPQEIVSIVREISKRGGYFSQMIPVASQMFEEYNASQK